MLRVYLRELRKVIRDNSPGFIGGARSFDRTSSLDWSVRLIGFASLQWGCTINDIYINVYVYIYTYTCIYRHRCRSTTISPPPSEPGCDSGLSSRAGERTSVPLVSNLETKLIVRIALQTATGKARSSRCIEASEFHRPALVCLVTLPFYVYTYHRPLIRSYWSPTARP